MITFMPKLNRAGIDGDWILKVKNIFKIDDILVQLSNNFKNTPVYSGGSGVWLVQSETYCVGASWAQRVRQCQKRITRT